MMQSQNIEEEHAGTRMHLFIKKEEERREKEEKQRKQMIKNGKHANETIKSYTRLEQTIKTKKTTACK